MSTQTQNKANQEQATPRKATPRKETLRHPWQLVAQREISTKLRDKTFIGSTAFMLIIVMAAVIIPALIAGNNNPDKIAVLNDAGAKVVQTADAIKGGESYEVTRAEDPAAAERMVVDGDVKAALLPGDNGYVVLGDDRVDTDLQNSLREAAVNLGMEQNAAQAGLTPEQLRANTQVQERLLNPGPLPEIVADFVNIGLALVFYMTALGFGMMIAQSVVQEKESRVVEILAAAVPIRALLWGKVIGNTVLALSQIVVIAAASLIGLLATDRADILEVIAPVAGWFVVFFVLGFVALAGLWAVAGSLATRQEDLGSTTLPGQMILMIPFFFSVFAGAEAKTVASFIPIASSMAMPGRMLTENVPVWQPLLAILVLLVATVLIVRLGARLYERTLLQTGRRLGYREAIAIKAS
ncbi:ABC-2 type transport system permease protein [Kribbella orskensis]|uniref:ABC-2 type transport system permease protein n=1 Tax=Kribbella orskensis TaxID=2512216 RepID=A0ABY2BT98_9ACTN|nr:MULTISPECIES: ABC transporter permease [Kribbella]TCN42735.1 ABC-2 type transport system permease protein [Kribbella sp. VKM Ac-2500]TCO29909.1 ABC-2 type transport system permease protein [Kribbella orskensis]